MGKYRFDDNTSKKQKIVHPVWRGIGCLLLLIVPVFSYVLADALIRFGVGQGWWFIPRGLLGFPVLPAIFRRFALLTSLFGWITRIENLYANLVIGVVIAALIFGLIGTVYAISYQAAAPPRYGPYDIPPPKYKPKKYKR